MVASPKSPIPSFNNFSVKFCHFLAKKMHRRDRGDLSAAVGRNQKLEQKRKKAANKTNNY